LPKKLERKTVLLLHKLFPVVLAAFAVASAQQQPEVIATGLQMPHRLVLTPGGNFLVTETSMEANQGRISLVTRSGQRSSILENLPSGTGGGGASGPTGMALRGRTLYFALGIGDAERPGANGARVFNPAGVSSPIFASVLKVQFSRDVDAVTSPFVLTAQHQRALNDWADVTINSGSDSITVSMLARFPHAEPIPGPLLLKFSNPWALTLSEDGNTLYVADASGDSLSRIDTSTGRISRFARFAPLPNVLPGVGGPTVDPVPTSVRLYGNQLLVSFLTGFPFIPGHARVLAVNPDGTTQPFIYGVTSVTDVLWRLGANGTGQFFVLEHSGNLRVPNTAGRLLRFDTPEPTVAAANLTTPVSLAYNDATKELFILELSGRILRLTLN
jgi:hypothetical protein